MVTPVVEKLWHACKVRRCAAHISLFKLFRIVTREGQSTDDLVLCLCNELLAQITFLPPTRNVVVYTSASERAFQTGPAAPAQIHLWVLEAWASRQGAGRQQSRCRQTSRPLLRPRASAHLVQPPSGLRGPAGAAAAAAAAAPPTLAPPSLFLPRCLRHNERSSRAVAQRHVVHSSSDHSACCVPLRNRLAPPRALQSRRPGAVEPFLSRESRTPARRPLPARGCPPSLVRGSEPCQQPLSLSPTLGGGCSPPSISPLSFLPHRGFCSQTNTSFFGLCGRKPRGSVLNTTV